MRKLIIKSITLIILILLTKSFPFFAYSQTNIDSISGRFEQLSKQLADLEKYVYGSSQNNELIDKKRLLDSKVKSNH